MAVNSARVLEINVHAFSAQFHRAFKTTADRFGTAPHVFALFHCWKELHSLCIGAGWG